MLIVFFSILALIMSAVFHEYAHGWAAYKLGDHTAKDMGRLSLNPIVHLDPVGSIFLPILLVLSNASFFIAWAKPVPYNPNNLNDSKYGDLKVSIAGPVMNFIIAIIFGFVVRIIDIGAVLKRELIINYFQGNYNFLLESMDGSILTSAYVMSIIVIFINLLLMVFNLIPIPPLDGSKVLYSFLSYDFKIRFHKIEQYSFFLLLFLVVTGLFQFIFTPVLYLFGIIVGF